MEGWQLYSIGSKVYFRDVVDGILDESFGRRRKARIYMTNLTLGIKLMANPSLKVIQQSNIIWENP